MTAVEWLDINLLGLVSFDSEELRKLYKDKIKQAKQIEEAQIIEAYDNGTRLFHKFDAEQYYNETYGNK